MLKEALQSALSAVEFAPVDAHAHFTLGMASYWQEPCCLEEALSAFERAVRIEPRNALACLYRTHCLHDAERWLEAADANDEVDVRALKGWRRELLIEQRAHCLLMAGRVEQALVGFLRRLENCEQALDRGERWPDSDPLLEPPALLVAAAAGRLRDALGARVEALVTRMGHERLIEVLRCSARGSS